MCAKLAGAGLLRHLAWTMAPHPLGWGAHMGWTSFLYPGIQYWVGRKHLTSIVWVCVPVCVHCMYCEYTCTLMHECVSTYTQTHLCGGQRSTLGVAFVCFPAGVLRQGLPLHLEFVDSLGCLASKSQRSSCLCLPGTGIADLCCCASVQIQVSMPVQQAFCILSRLPRFLG